MVNLKTSLLLPSAYRARQLRRALSVAYDSTDHPIEVCVSVVSDDYDSQNATRNYPIVLDVRSTDEYQRGAVYAWNKLLQRASGDVIALWADDLMPDYDWLHHALAELVRIGGHGLIGLNDLSSDGNEYAAHWLADRAFVMNELGGVMYPAVYKSWWCDREVTDRARDAGMYRWARRAIVEHANYTFGKSAVDRTYREAQPNYEADRLTYEARKLAGFPLDWIHREDSIILPVESQPAEVVATNRRKRVKDSAQRAAGYVANG